MHAIPYIEFCDMHVKLEISMCMLLFIEDKRLSSSSDTDNFKCVWTLVCCTCGNSKLSDPNVSFHMVPKGAEKGALWLYGSVLATRQLTQPGVACQPSYQCRANMVHFSYDLETFSRNVFWGHFSRTLAHYCVLTCITL